jgi:hypothetical protein
LRRYSADGEDPVRRTAALERVTRILSVNERRNRSVVDMARLAYLIEHLDGGNGRALHSVSFSAQPDSSLMV